jgi:hypothetical protein
MRAAFVMERAGESELWTVGSSQIPAREMGDYRTSACMGFDGKTLSIDGRYEISLSELLDGHMTEYTGKQSKEIKRTGMEKYQ